LTTVLAGLAFYACLQLRHFYDTAVLVPPTQRRVRDVQELRLPRLYFCPADRGRVVDFRWRSFECLLTYKDDHTTCPARIQGYRGRTPSEFAGHSDGEKGGECLEFGTHMIGVRREQSAAWNEISLRAAFDPGPGTGMPNALREVELGYLPASWSLGSGEQALERFYYPLLRVPVFFVDASTSGDGGLRAPHPLPQGVATRTYLGKEVDRGRTHAGRYWYTYGAMQLAVENVTMPAQNFMGADLSAKSRVGVVHVVVTLEDFEEFDFQVVSPFFPFMGLIGQLAGVGALLLWALTGRAVRLRAPKSAPDGSGPAASSGFSPDSVKDEEAAGLDEDGEEDQALLGTEAPKRRGRKGDEKGPGQSLLGTEGGDGL